MTFSYPLRRIPTLGDGSCFLHAVLRCIWSDYKDLSTSEKLRVVCEVRQELSDLIDKKGTDGTSYYDRLSRGELKDLSKSFSETQLEEMKRFLKSSEYFTHLYLEFISEVFEIDIYIIDYKSMNLYNHGDNELFYKDRNSIAVGYDEKRSHFEALEVEIRPGKFETFFEPDSNIIRELSSIK